MIEGFVHPRFGAVADLLARYTSKDGSFGAAVAVYHEGEKVVDVWGGVIDPLGRPWRSDTLAMSFSTTKGVTSTALHVLADRGLVDYDEPVATYWPEFAAAGKERVTVRHLLTHQAGLARIRGLVDDPFDLLDWDHVVGVLAGRPSDPPAGTGPGYHAMTYGWLVGEVVRRVAGKSLGAVVAAELAAPLGLEGLHIGLPADQFHRVAPLQPVPTERQAARAARVLRLVERLGIGRRLLEAMLVDDFDTVLHDPELRLLAAEVPAVNGAFDARSLARLYMALANDGELDGVRILSPERVREVGEIQVRKRDYCIGLDMRWRLGYHQAFTTTRRPKRGFGHFGYGGSGGWADPETRTGVGFVTNDLSHATSPFADLRFMRIGAAVRRAVLTLS